METDLEFVDYCKFLMQRGLHLAGDERARLLRLAETAALIGEHRMGIVPWHNHWDVQGKDGNWAERETLGEAVRAVAAKIGEGKG